MATDARLVQPELELLTYTSILSKNPCCNREASTYAGVFPREYPTLYGC